MRSALTLVVLAALLLITAHPAQTQTETVLYDFNGGYWDGEIPGANLTPDGAGNFFGTTSRGGIGYGTVFELSPNGSGGWYESWLFSLDDGLWEGSDPEAPVILCGFAHEYLCGTTAWGGRYGYGEAFQTEPGWEKSWGYSFSGSDVADPKSGLVVDAAGNLYGTGDGPAGQGGSVFVLDQYFETEQVIYSVDMGRTGLAIDAAGNLFGVDADGHVFELSPDGNGGWNVTNIQTFAPASWFTGTPVLDSVGNLYGTSPVGGAYGNGMVYKLSPRRTGKWAAKILHSFKGGKDGSQPYAGVVLDENGNIYGTTSGGGEYGYGTVFELVAPFGTRGYRKETLWSFNGTDGSNPWASLILDGAGNLYGTTGSGGSSGWCGPEGCGVVFEVSGVRAATANTLTSSPNPSSFGQAVTFTAVVTSRTGPPPDGETVKFKKGATVLGVGLLSGGTASFTTSTLPVGTNAVKAVYGGDTNFLSSTSNTMNQVVN